MGKHVLLYQVKPSGAQSEALWDPHLEVNFSLDFWDPRGSQFYIPDLAPQGPLDPTCGLWVSEAAPDVESDSTAAAPWPYAGSKFYAPSAGCKSHETSAGFR